MEAAEELVRVRSEEQLLAMPSLELTDTERYTQRYTQRYTHIIRCCVSLMDSQCGSFATSVWNVVALCLGQ